MANGYLTAASKLLANSSGQTFLPALFLLAHALELHFKAYLISRGVSETRLRSRELGHDLVACFREGKVHGICTYLALSKEQVYQLVRVSRYYQGKQLEYFAPASKRFGSVEAFRVIVEQVSKAVFNPIAEGDFRALSSKAI